MEEFLKQRLQKGQLAIPPQKKKRKVSYSVGHPIRQKCPSRVPYVGPLDFALSVLPIGEAKPEGIHDSWLPRMMGSTIFQCCPISQADRWSMCVQNSSGSP